MALLQDIQNAIIDSDRPLAGVLRMAMVLAARLDNPMLQEWAERELNGYPEDAPLPP
jgi:AbiTii